MQGYKFNKNITHTILTQMGQYGCQLQAFQLHKNIVHYINTGVALFI